jgi:hypothetical protein
MTITILITPGELVDRITILRLKIQALDNRKKYHEARRWERELQGLLSHMLVLMNDLDSEDQILEKLYYELLDVNRWLWTVEDTVRACEKRGWFGDDFTMSARAIYTLNDERSQLKKQINDLFNIDSEPKIFTGGEA